MKISKNCGLNMKYINLNFTLMASEVQNIQIWTVSLVYECQLNCL